MPSVKRIADQDTFIGRHLRKTKLITQTGVKNNNVGVIFIAPNMRETLRVKGQAVISREPALLQELAAKGKPALLATRITIDECFFHCGKAFIRSSFWKPESWPAGAKANIGKQIAARVKAGEDLAQSVEEGLLESYESELY